MQERFCDFMNALLIKLYTHADGLFNMARVLLEYFSKADLGPKMYSAIGQTKTRCCHATTKLHVDVGDKVNILMHATHHLISPSITTKTDGSTRFNHLSITRSRVSRR